jgi:hypothetical protein
MRVDIHRDIVLYTVTDNSMRYARLPRLDGLNLRNMVWRQPDIDRLDVGQDMLDFTAADDGDDAVVLDELEIK